MDEAYSWDKSSDSDVWLALKDGDRDALKVLFNRYYDELYQYALKLSGRSFIAEDCVQELFFRIWDRRNHLSEVTSVKAYLWISLRRDIFKAINKENPRHTEEEYIFYSDMLTFTKEDILIHNERIKEQKEALVDALNTLPDRHREAIYLKFYNGMGYEQIQIIMSVNYQTARNYVYHGVKALKKEFEDRIFTPSQKAAM